MHYFILSIRNRDLGCYVNRSLVSCILYADDVIICLFDCVTRNVTYYNLTASELLLELNVDESYGIAFGPNVGNLPSLYVGDKPLVESVVCEKIVS